MRDLRRCLLLGEDALAPVFLEIASQFCDLGRLRCRRVVGDHLDYAVVIRLIKCASHEWYGVFVVILRRYMLAVVLPTYMVDVEDEEEKAKKDEQ